MSSPNVTAILIEALVIVQTLVIVQALVIVQVQERPSTHHKPSKVWMCVPPTTLQLAPSWACHAGVGVGVVNNRYSVEDT